MPPRRLLILHPALAPYRVDMFNALARRCDLRLVFLADRVENQPFDQEKLRARLVQPPAYLLRGLTVAGRTVRLGIIDEVRRFKPEAIVTTEFGQATAAVIASRLMGGGAFGHVVGTEDNPASVLRETRLHALGRRVLQPLVDCVLTYSEDARRLYLERYRATQPVVASPLVQDEREWRTRLAAAAPAARALADAHGLQGKRVLLYVGRLAPEKRVDRLIDAAGRLGAAFPDLVLALVGDGPDRSGLETRAAAAAPGRVVFAGRVEGEPLAAWYRLGSVFALASEYEPFGAVVNEALVAGLPAVVSDRAGARVLVAPGKNGAVVAAGDPPALDRALGTWLGAVNAFDNAGIEADRASLMGSSFDDAVDAYLAAVEAARSHRGAIRP